MRMKNVLAVGNGEKCPYCEIVITEDKLANCQQIESEDKLTSYQAMD